MRIGIDLGGSHIGVGLIYKDKILEIRDKIFEPEDRINIKKSIIDISVSMINEILENQMISKEKIDLIGIASPGIISDGTIVKASNLSLENFCLCHELEEALDIRTQIRNDGKCAALAEKKYGSLKKYKDAIFLCIGTGIGGAAFLNGKLLEPSKNEAFEFGHMVIVKDGRQCTCGKKGCFETYASVKAMKNRITGILNINPHISGQYMRENLLVLDNKDIQDEVESWLNYLKIGVRKFN